ncbi:sensor histidine kinase [Belnapia rosea]|uniref:histidine kinase n=1 Tax=Belnapia rosea TaxID=938405 RepID=A0A1G6TQB6_9PROT|nr:PAS domain-containing protein [Belnapia rosea]SDB68957.1 PAS domain S-box-containing protein [Belnapia rosea]SDD30567.1 PAS domain S-box-containing protein [Belnapia rosea]
MSPGQRDAAEAGTAAEAEPSLLLDYAPVMIWQAGPDRSRSFVNQSWLDFTGRPAEAELGFGWVDNLHPEDRARCEQASLEGFASERPFTIDYRLRRHDGAWRWVLDTARPLCQDGVFTGFVGSCVDITEMREALEERRRALAEREVLLAELHHRVKNNAQATTSFLGLQASRASSPEVAAALRGAANRVMLATLVQDRMFRIAENAMIDLGTELQATAQSALDVVARPGIMLDSEVEAGLLMPVSQATPLALIVNELVVNAARHAFPDGHGGTVRLRLRRPAPGLGELVVEDDGIGLQEAQRRTSPQGCLGLHLVPRLARQAHASLRLEADHGTRATLRFACG